MDYLSIIILGIVQGITEFLPISSDGHLVIVSEILRRWRGLSEEQLASIPVIVALHIGTLLSIVVVFRRELIDLVRRPRLLAPVVVATLPLVVIGKPLSDALESIEHASWFPMLAGAGLCFTALLMFLSRYFDGGQKTVEDFGVRPRGWIDALIVGLLQCIAPLPGVSRSGSTIFAAMTRGYTRVDAARFSFLIAVPAIGGAVTLHLRSILKGDLGTPLPVLATGVVVSFLVGLAALEWLLRIVARGRLHWFAWYCLIVGIGVIVWQFSLR